MADRGDVDAVGRLLDAQAIVAVAVRYCWVLDSRDWAALGEVFLPDATARLGDDRRLDGLDAIAGRCRAALSSLDASQHIVATHQVEVGGGGRDGDAATHRCYVHAQHVRRAAEGGAHYVVGGRYEDRLVRTAAGWRIAERDLVVMWTEGNPAVLRP